jgi:hypothetical protein
MDIQNVNEAGSSDLVIQPARKIKRTQLINRLNVLHFRGDPILVVLEHKAFGYQLILEARLQLCHGERLKAIWNKSARFPRNLHSYSLVKVIIPGAASTLEFLPHNFFSDHEFFESSIPEQVDVMPGREIARYLCVAHEIKATLIQNSIGFSGELIDFSPNGIRVRVTTTNQQNYYWLSPEMPVTLTLARDGEIIYSGPMSVLRIRGDQVEKDVVLQQTLQTTPRYRPRIVRTKRMTMQPTPSVTFRHPLLGENRTLRVKDIATLGLCVEESPDRSVLIAGMLLPEVKLFVAGSLFISFSGQVVYRREENNRVLCGIAVLDIDIQDHFKLIGLIHQAEDERAYVGISHDAEVFFEFMFDCGFLYPAKYAEIDINKQKFVEAYEKLYHNPTSVARCFAYIEDGQIQGHCSTLRIYKYAWMNHHHAAISSKRVGLRVLRQISEFISSSYYLNPMQLRYIVAIYRPDNSFPQKFFGGFADKEGDPQKCSVDTFAYFHLAGKYVKGESEIKGPWQMAKATESDMHEFEGFYSRVSGGLLVKAYDLNPRDFKDTSVAEAYRSSGLKRERHLYAVRYGLDLAALIEVQDSDTGLNLSELTNAVTIFVLDQERFTPKVMEMVQDVICDRHEKEHSPILVYPASYAKRFSLPAEKDYSIWVLNLDFADDYMKHLYRFCR